jgi:hypothetical protein
VPGSTSAAFAGPGSRPSASTRCSPTPISGIPTPCSSPATSAGRSVAVRRCRSIDVLEHLEDEDSAAALANIVTGASMVILSCAPPGQGGHHHVNERPRRYWVARMAKLGWLYQRRETGALERSFLERRDQLPWSWMYHNLCLYRPEATVRTRSGLLSSPR